MNPTTNQPDHNPTISRRAEIRGRERTELQCSGVIRRIHRRGTSPDPLRGVSSAGNQVAPTVVEYEPDTALRDTEQMFLTEEVPPSRLHNLRIAGAFPPRPSL